MIRDLSLTLQALLDDPALANDFPELFAAQIVFDRPSDGFNPNVPTVDLFLFDVRENLELRSAEPLAVRSNRQFSLTQPPLRVACSYLVTAWAAGGGDLPLQEQRLLSQTLQVLARYPSIPTPFLRGTLVGQEPTLPMMAAKSEGISDPHEFWTAIGNKMRASIIVTATIAMDVFPPVIAPQVVVSRIQLDRRAAPGTQELVAGASPARFRIGGRVTDAAGGAVADTGVQIAELGLAATTDGEGNYQIGAMGAGSYTMQVGSGAGAKTVGVTLPPAAGASFDVTL